MTRIEATFRKLQQSGRSALMPYLTMGYPEHDSALSLVPALANAGADLLELGVPFSDPLADGATIQAASQRALLNGMTLQRCLSQAKALRTQGVTIPFILMGYYNPIIQFGIERFAAAAAAAGIDGLILPDLPPEESEPLERALAAYDIALIFLLAPTSNSARIQIVAERSEGFIYLVSLVGVTGARDEMAHDLAAFVERVRTFTARPLAVGFGISTPEHAAQVGRMADGVIIGSALIKTIGAADDPVSAAETFIAALRHGMDHPNGRL